MTAPSNPDPRRRRIAVSLILVLGIVCCFYPLALQSFYGVLVFDQPANDCRYAFVTTPTPECLELAANLINSGEVQQILLVSMNPRRSIRIGAIDPEDSIYRLDLIEQGVAEDRIRLVATDAETVHQQFRSLNRQLAQSAEQASDRQADGNRRCAVITTSTLSRYYRAAIDQAVPESAANYAVVSVLPDGKDAQRWWKSRSGVARILNHGLRLAFVYAGGESETLPADPYQHLLPKTASL